MKVIGYIRVSTDKQDLAKQQHLLLEYAQANQLLIDEFINVEISSRPMGGTTVLAWVPWEQNGVPSDQSNEAYSG